MGLIADQLQLERKQLNYKVGHKKILRKEPGKIIKGGKGEDDNKHRRENERQGIW